MPSPNPLYHEVKIVPALHEIQERHGYLEREALVRFAQENDIPLQKLQAVASFFPHFRLTPPTKVILRVCRDMACHMAGSAEIIAKLAGMNPAQVTVQGASCLGRCDRAPAACVELAGHEHELYYLGRTADQLRTIVAACAADAPPKPDTDIDHAGLPAGSKVNPYGGAPDYAGVQKAVLLRDASLDAAARVLKEKLQFSAGRIDIFRKAATIRMRGDIAVDADVAKAVRAWQTESDWAAGPELGGWSDALLKELKAASLRGMGGAGIPATTKWHDVREAVRTARRRARDDRAFIVVNGDESEPGTFKDRELLLRTPHLIVEGVIIAGLITEATQGFIYIRHEYGEQIAACREEIRRAEQLGMCGENAFVLGRPFPVSVFVSPGGYICGEQSALIEAMSDHRGEPRNMPPTLETNGLDDMPTLVSNVETYAWVPYICIHGGQAYANEGVNTWHGRRFFSISGDVRRPGVYEVPMGLTLRELIFGDQYCQGIDGDRKLKGFAPSGPSGGFLPAILKPPAGLSPRHAENEAWKPFAERRGFDPAGGALDILDMELELDLFRAFSPTQALGAGLVVYAEGRDMAAQAVNSLEFYRNESCGKCVPCRLGSQKFASLGAHLLAGKIGAQQWEKELLPLMSETGEVLKQTSICGLGRSVPMPLGTVATFFADDLASHLSTAPNPPAKK